MNNKITKTLILITRALHKVLLIALCITLWGCGDDQRDWDVDTSDIQYDPSIYRLDFKLSGSTASTIQANNQNFSEDLGTFYTYYLDEMLHAGHPDDPAIGERLMKFVKDSAIDASFQSIRKKFKSVDQYVSIFKNGMKRLKFHFEDIQLPETIIFYHSLFSNGVLSTDTQLAVGIEMYLGPDDPIVKKLPGQNFPKYFKEKMVPRFLPVDMARSWIENQLYAGEQENKMADIMIEKGKIIYLLHAIYPDMEEAKLLRYETEDFEWCEKNEYQIWQYLVDQKYIYSDDPNVHRNFFSEGPFTPGLPEGAPSKVGEYMGFTIVKQYMNKNQDVGLKKLIDTKNIQKILNAYEVEEQ